jgi:hypothetical protein
MVFADILKRAQIKPLGVENGRVDTMQDSGDGQMTSFLRPGRINFIISPVSSYQSKFRFAIKILKTKLNIP